MPKKTTEDAGSKRVSVIRFIYLYMISAITFIVFLIGAIGLVNLALEVFVFDLDKDYYGYDRPMVNCEYLVARPVVDGGNTEIAIGAPYDDCMEKQKALEEKQNARWISESVARDLSIGMAQVAVALPLWIFHWRIIERDRRRKKQ